MTPLREWFKQLAYSFEPLVKAPARFLLIYHTNSHVKVMNAENIREGYRVVVVFFGLELLKESVSGFYFLLLCFPDFHNPCNLYFIFILNSIINPHFQKPCYISGW